MPYEPLHHKYRPQTFADLVGQDAIATTLTNAIRQNRIAPAYLFTGPRGTGKTSSARILAKSLNCLNTKEPTETPCGQCEVCRTIANGTSLDTIEIDAASNTGVDNIRELIERAQFAPVQCRQKVYIIDECLTGDTPIQTAEGLMRIDDPSIKNKEVLSYNELSGNWEMKKVLRWLERGERETLTLKTENREIRCTGNHLIRTDKGWIAADRVKPGMKILSPSLMKKPLNRVKNAKKNSHSSNLSGRFVPVTVGIQPSSSFTVTAQATQIKHIPTLSSTPIPPEKFWAFCNTIPSPQWVTNLETVQSVEVADRAKVYDIEVEDNHNFVANGLLVHNCHMLSTAAFNSLLKTLEEPPDRVVFVLATTDPQRVLPTIISRCQRFDFRRIPIDAMVQHLIDIARNEKIDITDEAVLTVAQIAQGGLRDAESLLDQLSLLEGQVTVEKVWDLVGAVPERDLMELLEAIAADNGERVLDRARELMNRGREPLIVLHNLASFYRDLLIAKTAPSRLDLVALTPPTWERLCQTAQQWQIHTILAGQQHLRTCEVQIKNTTQPRLWLEVTLLGLLPSAIATQMGGGEISASSRPQAAPTQTPPPRSQSTPPAPQQHRVAPTPEPDSAPKTPPQRPPEERRDTPPTPARSAPANATPAPNPTADESPSTGNLEQIWQTVLEHLPLPSKALFKQHGYPLAIEAGQVQVGIRSFGLYKMAQTKISDLEAAFSQALHQRVKVVLQVGGEGNSAPQRSPEPPPEKPQKSPSQEGNQGSAIAPPKHEPPAENRPTSPPRREDPVEDAKPSQPQPSIPVGAIGRREMTGDRSLDSNEAIAAAKQFSQHFNGKLVTLPHAPTIADEDRSPTSDRTEFPQLEDNAPETPPLSVSPDEASLDLTDLEDDPYGGLDF